MRDFVSVTHGFHQATELLSMQRHETVSLVLSVFQVLKNSLGDDAPELQTDEGDKFRSALLKSFNFYMTKYPYFQNDLLKAATFLDAR